MERGTKPTRAQKMQMSAAGLNWKNWLVLNDTPEEMEIINKPSGKVRKIHAIMPKKAG